ncbi:ABC transporter substrate-binding protein [Clostridium cellulovorans]|uniref:Extracellular solute-binding protein family 1 n=1 Tax=Clostridium cellulovorans (strain ATCC 35296 / DSM 3052 / OCM 3 / 743B) TaxID=573061 RepID=D9SUA4_CLOC7|nr:ABC transporter substrate-binding protein [Clostridium cellulovorans]ADL52859.1 extracellular solute-binding protein family 1 [Clostridium cellulovorans 743B]
MKIEIRKILLVFIAIFLITNTACSKPKETKEKVVKGNLVICADGDNDYINFTVQEFKNKYPTVNVTVENTSDYNIENKDIMIIKDEVAKEFIDNNDESLYTLNDEEVVDIDNIKGDKLNNLNIDGKQYGVPWYTTPVAIVYNKNYINTLNVNIDSINTYGDYLALGDKLPTLGDVKLLSLSRNNLNSLLKIFLVQGNINIEKQVKGEKTLILGDLIRGIFNKKLNRDLSSEDEAIKSFAQGKEISLIVTPMMINKIEKNYPEAFNNIVFQKLPALYNGSNRNVVLGGSDVFINKNSQNIDAAIAFMNFISSDYSNMKKLYDNFKVIPAHYYIYHSKDFSVGVDGAENKIYELCTNMAIRGFNYDFYEEYRSREELFSKAITISLDSQEELKYIIEKLEIQMWTNQK